jgi:hypothetical protein
MRIYVLRLDGRAELARAFERVQEEPQVASCAIELELDRIRFLAPRKVAERLVERIYREGGLVWCSRHEFAVVEPAQWPGAPGASRSDR